MKSISLCSRLPLGALCARAGIGVTEFSPSGNVGPTIAMIWPCPSLGQGMLISATAFGVLIGVPFMILVFCQACLGGNLAPVIMGIFTWVI